VITLETGVPGSGKTLHTLSWVKAKADKEGREVFYSGIADLNLP
jgi:zona occludens toxin